MTNSEINRKIATDLFKHVLVHKVWGKNKQYESWTIGEPEYYDFAGDMQLQNHVPNYCGSIKQAWTVIEELFNLDKSEPTILKVYGPLSNGYAVTPIWEHHDGPIELGTIVHESAPMAICLAALEVINSTCK